MRTVQQNSRHRVLFLCTGNSCRSQIAEGWCRALHGERIDAFSAGVEPHTVNPIAIEVMSEAGVDISSHRSRHVREFADDAFDLVITVCDHAAETCPSVPGARVLHVPFDDPPRLAANARSPVDAMNIYRRVRDEIREFIRTLPSLLESTKASSRS